MDSQNNKPTTPKEQIQKKKITRLLKKIEKIELRAELKQLLEEALQQQTEPDLLFKIYKFWEKIEELDEKQAKIFTKTKILKTRNTIQKEKRKILEAQNQK